MDSIDGDWSAWSECAEILERVGRRSGLSVADVEIAVTRVLISLASATAMHQVHSPKAWSRTLFARECWRLRRTLLPVPLTDDLIATATTEGDGDVDNDQLRLLLAAHVGFLCTHLTRAEQAIFAAVKAGNSLEESAQLTGMSPRDARTRFRRITVKLREILAPLVPPPPPLGNIGSHFRPTWAPGGEPKHLRVREYSTPLLPTRGRSM